MSVYGYIRSATGNAEQLEQQRQHIRASFAESQVPIAEFFEDYATGFFPPMDREGYGRMCEQLKEGDIVIIADLGRIARSARLLGDALEWLKRRGVTVQLANLDENR
jgi:DNA invertase Pin-like site-specific DNA recombinase